MMHFGAVHEPACGPKADAPVSVRRGSLWSAPLMMDRFSGGDSHWPYVEWCTMTVC
jgi:hypothetical protein